MLRCGRVSPGQRCGQVGVGTGGGELGEGVQLITERGYLGRVIGVRVRSGDRLERCHVHGEDEIQSCGHRGVRTGFLQTWMPPRRAAR